MLSNLETSRIPPSDVRRTVTEVIHASRQEYPLNPSGFLIEVGLACEILNTMTGLGMPDSVRVR